MAWNSNNPFDSAGDGNSDNHGSDNSRIPDYEEAPF